MNHKASALIKWLQTKGKRSHAFLCGCLILLLLLPFSGCNTFGNSKIVQQLQGENERLLTEFRAERKRRELAERENMTLENRLAESEKLLARQNMSVNPQRLSSLQSAASNPLNAANSSGSPYSSSSSPSDSSTSNGDAGTDFKWQRRVN